MNSDCPYCEEKCKDLKCDCAKFLAYKDAQNPEMVEKILSENNFDISKSSWELLMQMQKSFAKRLHKIDNLSKDEVDKWVDKYLVCIDDEVREVREYLNLYNNDDIKDNSAELKKEVIDILHFMMDLFLVGNANSKIIKDSYCKKYMIDVNSDDFDLISIAYNVQSMTINDYLSLMSSNEDFNILKATCKLLDADALVRQQISWKHWKKPSNEINYDKLYDAFALVFHEFINLTILTMKLDEIKGIYVKKNVENIQRQYYGY